MSPYRTLDSMFGGASISPTSDIRTAAIPTLLTT